MAKNKAILDIEVNSDQAKKDIKKLNKESNKILSKSARPGGAVSTRGGGVSAPTASTGGAMGGMAGMAKLGGIAAAGALAVKGVQSVVSALTESMKLGSKLQSISRKEGLGMTTGARASAERFEAQKESQSKLFNLLPIGGETISAYFDAQWERKNGKTLELMKRRARTQEAGVQGAAGDIDALRAAGFTVDRQAMDEALERNMEVARMQRSTQEYLSKRVDEIGGGDAGDMQARRASMRNDVVASAIEKGFDKVMAKLDYSKGRGVGD